MVRMPKLLHMKKRKGGGGSDKDRGRMRGGERNNLSYLIEGSSFVETSYENN